MSADLITLGYAKAHVRLDHDAEDADVSAKISAASVMLIAYLKTGALSFLDENGDLLEGATVPADVQEACARLVAELFKNRDAGAWEHGYLPHWITGGIYMRRDPACA